MRLCFRLDEPFLCGSQNTSTSVHQQMERVNERRLVTHNSFVWAQSMQKETPGQQVTFASVNAGPLYITTQPNFAMLITFTWRTLKTILFWAPLLVRIYYTHFQKRPTFLSNMMCVTSLMKSILSVFNFFKPLSIDLANEDRQCLSHHWAVGST